MAPPSGLRVVIAGSSGLIGQTLTDHLRGRGHTVTRLVRRETTGSDESRWDPYAAEVDQAVVDQADVVVNLAGSSLLGDYRSP